MQKNRFIWVLCLMGLSGMLAVGVHVVYSHWYQEEKSFDVSVPEYGQHTSKPEIDDFFYKEGVEESMVIQGGTPEIIGVQRYYLVPGSRPDYLANVTALDPEDGELSARIKVDDAEVNLLREGKYVLGYAVEDSDGLMTRVETIVTVAKADDIQEMIGKREIDCWADVVEGAPNVYDVGVSGSEDLEATLREIRPMLVHLYHEGEYGGYSSGSGYIMEITEDKIYICTNRHVVTNYEQWDVYFWEGSKAPALALGAGLGYDVGVAVVELEDVSEELLKQLKTVHIDLTYWQALDEEPIKLGLERLDREGGTLHAATGELVKVRQYFEWDGRLEHTEVTVELVHGDSGSAVVDGYGNLMGMAYAYSTDPMRYWCVPLDEILDCYQQITGRVPYIY